MLERIRLLLRMLMVGGQRLAEQPSYWRFEGGLLDLLTGEHIRLDDAESSFIIASAICGARP